MWGVKPSEKKEEDIREVSDLDVQRKPAKDWTSWDGMGLLGLFLSLHLSTHL